MVKLKKLYFQGQLGTKLKNTKTKDQVKKTHLNLGVFFKLCKGGNWIDYWNHNSIKDLIE